MNKPLTITNRINMKLYRYLSLTSPELKAAFENIRTLSEATLFNETIEALAFRSFIVLRQANHIEALQIQIENEGMTPVTEEEANND